VAVQPGDAWVAANHRMAAILKSKHS
jgi:hypothetical protein